MQMADPENRVRNEVLDDLRTGLAVESETVPSAVIREWRVWYEDEAVREDAEVNSVVEQVISQYHQHHEEAQDGVEIDDYSNDFEDEDESTSDLQGSGEHLRPLRFAMRPAPLRPSRTVRPSLEQQTQQVHQFRTAKPIVATVHPRVNAMAEEKKALLPPMQMLRAPSREGLASGYKPSMRNGLRHMAMAGHDSGSELERRRTRIREV